MECLQPVDAESERLTSIVFACCDAVHRALGSGFLPATYREELCRQFARRRIPFRVGAKFPVFYRGVRLDACHVVDVCVSGRIMIDVLAVEKIRPGHCTALQSRLRLTGLHVGLVTNFRSARLVLGTLLVREAGAFCLSARTIRAARLDLEGGSTAQPPC